MAATSFSSRLFNRTVPIEDEKLDAPALDKQASYIVHNRYMRIGYLFLFAVIGVEAYSTFRMAAAIENVQPMRIHVNPDGTASVQQATLNFKPREPEMRYFLKQFIRDHYGRERAIAREAFSRKLTFMNPTLRRAMLDEEIRTKEITKFVNTAHGTEVLIEVANPSIEDMRQSPYRASVDFEKVFRSQDGNELKREKYRAHVQFHLLEKIPVSVVEHNPLGFEISYFREDQAFQ